MTETTPKSTGHTCKLSNNISGYYEIAWFANIKIFNNPPKRIAFRKTTEKKNAERFCKKHNLTLPEPPTT